MDSRVTLGTLAFGPVDATLLAPATAALLATHPSLAQVAATVEIDPNLADTAALTQTYGLTPEASANCVIVRGKRGGEERVAACVVLSHTRADVNHLVKRTLDVRKLSFAPQDWAVETAQMEYGGITPVGLPDDWTILVDRAVTEQAWVIVGSGLRRSKLALPGAALGLLPGAQVLDDLGLVPNV
jgi:prolyl-tRNA editing enzyme YbaK/EbsC (Cys-tRNA(Pro) deacylase)